MTNTPAANGKLKVQDILTDESKWTQRWMARDKYGSYIAARSDEAICWCLLGAVEKAYGTPHELKEAKRKLYDRLGSMVGVWNDAPERTFAEVHDLIVELDI